MDETQRRIEAVFRIEWARLVAGLARFVRGDLGTAEELAQDALVAALETWPEDGIPREPGAWLMQVAKNRALKIASIFRSAGKRAKPSSSRWCSSIPKASPCA